jgi:hypothetical protein
MGISPFQAINYPQILSVGVGGARSVGSVGGKRVNFFLPILPILPPSPILPL